MFDQLNPHGKGVNSGLDLVSGARGWIHLSCL